MSKNLAILLNKPEHVLEGIIGRLEELSGWQSTDVKLLAEINSTLRKKTADLGLDPNDTTGAELYFSLINRFQNDNKELTKKLNLDKNNAVDFTNTIIQTAQQLTAGSQCFAIKNSAAKRILSNNPPKNLMRLLKYRSIDSMLKREKIAQIYVALPYIESGRWFKAFDKELKKLKSMDFEVRPVEINSTSNHRWQNIGYRQPIMVNVLTGTVLVRPLHQKKAAAKALIEILEAISKVKDTSTTLSKLQWTTSFEKELIRLSSNKSRYSSAKIASERISWKSLHRHLDILNAEEVLADFYKSDNKNESTSQLLSKIHSGFNWWDDTAYIGRRRNIQPISLHIYDIAKSFEEKLQYEERNVKYLYSSLWDELIGRYLSHQGVESHVLGQLDLAPQPADEISMDDLIGKEASLHNLVVV